MKQRNQKKKSNENEAIRNRNKQTKQQGRKILIKENKKNKRSKQ